MVEIALLCVFPFSKSLVFVSFLRLSDRSHTQEQAGSIPSKEAVAPGPSHNKDGSEKVRTVRQKNPSLQTVQSPKIRERLVVTPR